MPKMKTHKGAKRRFKVTGNGHVLQAKQGRGVKRNRHKRVRRLYGKMLPTSETNRHHLEVALPYGLK
ncbi:MAG: 50S ribosomal protein L35 [Chloroflexaceae bacterium]|nr:50S ribosomal protein L35 [Chloroflexaceae bacterium]